jgi:hypothetical protein
VGEDRSELIAKMRARAEQCRRLARALTERRAAEILIAMAEEVEGDIARLEAEQSSGEASSKTSKGR